MITFPKNPSNAMIFESSPGLFFQYDASTNCWVRVDGMDALGLATPLVAGLMSSDDFKKLDGLILPPPQASIKGEECPVTFTEGKIRLTSTDESLFVKPALNVINTVGNTVIGGEEPWALHENTVGIDFKLNVDALLEEMRKNGKFTQVMIQGRQGPKGEKGANGINELDTGPVGDDGVDGTNSPYDGSLGPEINQFTLADQTSNRAIVDVKTETNATGNFLVVTRANVGNPNACPKEVKPKDITTPLILVLNQKDNAVLRKVEAPNDCGSPCTVCVTSLHHLNMENLVDSIFDRFKERVALLKQEKEELVAIWLRAMITLFNEQKAAICCALENCRSANRNQRTRQYIEQQRIQAAQGDFSLVVDGVQDRKVVDMDPDKTCLQPGDLVVRRGVGCDCAIQYTLDAKIHATDPRSLFLSKQEGLVDTTQIGVFGSDRKGSLNVNQEISKPGADRFTSDTEPATAKSTILGNSGVVPPPQTSNATNWKIYINDFQTIVGPTEKIGTITVSGEVSQEGLVVGRFEKVLDLITLSSQTLELPAISSLNFGAAADITKPLNYKIEITSRTIFERTEALSTVGVSLKLHKVILIGIGSLATVEMILKDDWNNNDYTLNGTQVLNPGLGFAQFGLPAGEYIAEIMDCCANVSRSRSLFMGMASIEYNKTQTTTETETIVREVLTFPDLGMYNNNLDARVAYLGSTFSFIHAGGQIRSWVIDPDLLPSNNAGSITICIKPVECSDPTTAPSSDTIFIYRKEISPLNLIGLIRPFSGGLIASGNYGYGNDTAGADDVVFGPPTVLKNTKSFFYSGVDGLSFFTINGGTGGNSYNIKMTFDTINNSVKPSLRVADDPGEVMPAGTAAFIGDWTVPDYGSDGIVIGPYDLPNGGWVISVNAEDLASHQVWQAVSVDGNIFNLALDPTGIGTKINESVLFTPINAGCLMPYKQVVWLERGHRIGAACSAVVELDGQKYIIAKRSIGDDNTCGGGESLSNPCISTYISVGLGHPAIAWPTINGEEFVGIPTSGYQGFVFDQSLSDRIMEKIRAGETENVHGDPINNIPFVLMPTAQ
jgi:hypothetical protein